MGQKLTVVPFCHLARTTRNRRGACHKLCKAASSTADLPASNSLFSAPLEPFSLVAPFSSGCPFRVPLLPLLRFSLSSPLPCPCVSDLRAARAESALWLRKHNQNLTATALVAFLLLSHAIAWTAASSSTSHTSLHPPRLLLSFSPSCIRLFFFIHCHGISHGQRRCCWCSCLDCKYRCYWCSCLGCKCHGSELPNASGRLAALQCRKHRDVALWGGFWRAL